MERRLSSQRLRLRPLRREDGGFLVELDSDPAVMRFISRGQPTPPERIHDVILPRLLAEADEHAPYGYWLAEDRSSGEPLGWFHLRPERVAPHEIELGYRLARRAWGRGLAREGSRALLVIARDRWSLRRAVATTLVENWASRRVLEACGLAKEELFVYSGEQLPGWSRAERHGVRYGIDAEGLAAVEGSVATDPSEDRGVGTQA